MNNVLEKEVPVEVDTQEVLTLVHDSVKMEKELQEWIQQVLKMMLSEI
jgi:hypothetical protein